METTKEQLVNNIKDWIKIDTEIAQLKAEIKERNNKKKAFDGSRYAKSYYLNN